MPSEIFYQCKSVGHNKFPAHISMCRGVLLSPGTVDVCLCPGGGRFSYTFSRGRWICFCLFSDCAKMVHFPVSPSAPYKRIYYRNWDLDVNKKKYLPS